MVDIIQAIFLSETCGEQKFKLPQDKDYDRLTQKEDELYDKLKATLSPEIFKVFTEFFDAVSDVHAMLTEQYYTAGFKTGFRLAAQANDFSDIFE
ncbi:MAG: hypothetical protein J1F61_00030 [Clostridiales bacterium]|nr:hypothetical protein [Clostridiales bacterium]